MPQSLSSVYLHLVFSTKDRYPFFEKESLRADLHSYLSGISQKLGCPPIKIGGVADHVHILARFGRSITQAEWVKELKRVSSIWANEKLNARGKFHWQKGYGTFSVAPSDLDSVIAYIENQKEHHKKITFQDEYRRFLKRAKIEYDEKYVWE